MPVKRCRSKGRSGHKYGGKGKCYVGNNSRQRAAKQGRAIQANWKHH